MIAAGWDYDQSSRTWRINRETRQSRVWNQVSRQEGRSGARETNSLEPIMREDSSTDLNLGQLHREVLNQLRTYDGQNGALIGFEGEPLLMEFFSDEDAAKTVLKETLISLAFDVDQFSFRPASKSHVEAFIRESGVGELQMLSEDDWALLMAGGSEHIDTKATLDRNNKVMHLTSIHRSHRILMEV